MAGSPQILLPLERRRADRLEDFVPGPNAAAVAALEELLEADGGCIFLRGPASTGKSHLLNALCNRAQDAGLNAFYIAPGALPNGAAAGLTGLESYDLVCVDDIDRIAGKRAWEEALFHCFNRLREQSRRLVIASGQPLASISFALPDLRSRLAWGLRLQLEPLADRDKEEVLQRHARVLGIELPADVKRYLLSRESRDLATLVETLEAIRTAALAGKRRITVPLAREVLSGG